MIFVSHDRMFLRGLGSRVLELGGESGMDRHPTVYPGSYVEYVQKLGGARDLFVGFAGLLCNGSPCGYRRLSQLETTWQRR
jgi:hypothetical protein